MAYKINSTPYPELGYIKQDEGLWRFVDITDGSDPNNVHVVGPHYSTEKSLLGDMDRYAKESWGHSDKKDSQLDAPIPGSDYSLKVKIDPLTGQVGVTIAHNIDSGFGMECLFEINKNKLPSLHVGNAIGGVQSAHIDITHEELQISIENNDSRLACQGAYEEPDGVRAARENVERIESLASRLGLDLTVMPNNPDYKPLDRTCVGAVGGELSFEDSVRKSYQKALQELEFVRNNPQIFEVDESVFARISSEIKNETSLNKGLS